MVISTTIVEDVAGQISIQINANLYIDRQTFGQTVIDPILKLKSAL